MLVGNAIANLIILRHLLAAQIFHELLHYSRAFQHALEDEVERAFHYLRRAIALTLHLSANDSEKRQSFPGSTDKMLPRLWDVSRIESVARAVLDAEEIE